MSKQIPTYLVRVLASKGLGTGDIVTVTNRYGQNNVVVLTERVGSGNHSEGGELVAYEHYKWEKATSN